MKTIVIGNGFDLNLGLRTSYQDFLQSKEFNYTAKRYKHHQSLFSYLKSVHSNKRWVDIENELVNFSKSNRLKSTDNFEEQYFSLVESLKSYIENLDYSKINRESHAYELIRQQSEIKNQVFNIHSFNYTNTFEILFNEIGTPAEKWKNNPFFVHGSTLNDDIIFGVNDKADIDVKHIFLKKSFNLNYRQTGLLNFFTQSSVVMFFGHSLGNTDHAYFRHFFKNQSKDWGVNSKTIEFYYYGAQGYKDLMTQLDFLTERNLTNLKQFNNIVFHDCSK